MALQFGAAPWCVVLSRRSFGIVVILVLVIFV